MTLKAYIYNMKIKVAVLAESEEEANTKLEQGQATQISMEKEIVSNVDIP